MASPTHYQRTYLFFYNPNFLASYFVFSIPLSLCLLHERYKKQNPLLYLLTLIQIGGFITTLSRAGSLGFSASILFLIFLRSSKKIWRHVAIFLLIAILCGCVLVMSMPHTFTPLIGIRSPIWQGTHKMIKENLLTGTGIGSFSKVYPSFRPPEYFLFRDAAPMTLHSHNEFLEIWAELGIIGLLLWCGFLVSLFYFVLKKIDSSNSLFIHGALSGIVGLFIQNMFSVSLRIPFINFYLWIGLGMSMALIKNKNFGQAPLRLQGMFPQAKKLILAFLFLGLIIWTSVRFIVFPFLGDFYFGRGYLERRKGNLSRAISYYSKAINFTPQPRDIYYKRAFILGKTGREKDALNDYLKVEEISPGYARIYRNLGITYLSLGEIDKAIENLNKAIATNPYDSHAHNSLGVAYEKMRR
ncbi:MAG: tetratricopeptide repeat protein [Candidatus Omnitrophica bacterium]|nr:tetratricopeptide repeat protein [Candidatus Omnitrophota bacterium]